MFGGGLFTRDDGLTRGARGLAHPSPHSSSSGNVAQLYANAGDSIRSAGPPGGPGASAADRLTAAFGAIGVSDRDEVPSRSATAPLLPFENGGFGNHRVASSRAPSGLGGDGGNGSRVDSPARQASGGAPPFPGSAAFGSGGNLNPNASYASVPDSGTVANNANPYAAAQMQQMQQMQMRGAYATPGAAAPGPGGGFGAASPASPGLRELAKMAIAHRRRALARLAFARLRQHARAARRARSAERRERRRSAAARRRSSSPLESSGSGSRTKKPFVRTRVIEIERSAAAAALERERETATAMAAMSVHAPVGIAA